MKIEISFDEICSLRRIADLVEALFLIDPVLYKNCEVDLEVNRCTVHKDLGNCIVGQIKVHLKKLGYMINENNS